MYGNRLLPGLDPDGQMIFTRGHGAGCKGRNGTGRIVGLIEIKEHLLSGEYLLSGVG